MNKMIEECLKSYKKLIDSKKSDELSVSNYKVDKPWGYEIWLELNEFYAFKLIFMKKGFQSSLQSHEFKYETNFVIEGTAEVLLENEEGNLISNVYNTGNGWSVPIGKKHRVIAKEDYKALEVSTPHLDDVIRYEDDSDRKDGKIENEHEL